MMFGGDKHFGKPLILIDEMIKHLCILKNTKNQTIKDEQLKNMIISNYATDFKVDNNITSVIQKLNEKINDEKKIIENKIKLLKPDNNYEKITLERLLEKIKQQCPNTSAYLKYLKYKNKYINLKNMIGNGKKKLGSIDSLGSLSSLATLKGSKNMLTNKNVLKPAIEAVMNMPQVKQILKAAENPVILNYAIIALIKTPEFKLAIKATKMPFAEDMFKHLLEEKDIKQNIIIARTALEERKDLQKIAKQIIIHKEIVKIINEPSVNKLIIISIEENEDIAEMANIIGFKVKQGEDEDEEEEEE